MFECPDTRFCIQITLAKAICTLYNVTINSAWKRHAAPSRSYWMAQIIERLRIWFQSIDAHLSLWRHTGYESRLILESLLENLPCGSFSLSIGAVAKTIGVLIPFGGTCTVASLPCPDNFFLLRYQLRVYPNRRSTQPYFFSKAFLGHNLPWVSGRHGTSPTRRFTNPAHSAL